MFRRNPTWWRTVVAPTPVRISLALHSRVTLVPLALTVGVLTGLGAVAFRWLVVFFTRMFTGYADYSALGRAPSAHWPALGWWFLLGAPVVAGAVYGPIVHHFAPEARGHGVPEVMYAVARNNGRIKPQVTIVKALASALCIGGGGSVGREGPIVQIGSAAGSALGQALRLDTDRIRLLVACGAAGGISATFNAPLAGVFFALELILRNFAAESAGVVVLSSVAAAVVGRTLMGDHPFLSLPGFTVHHPVEYALYAALGVGSGIVGTLFSRVLYWVEDACDWLWRGPQWARPAVGGIALGALLIALPQMYGVGYPVLHNAIDGQYALAMLLVLMIGKIFATSLTIGIGGSGGVFAPTLFIGAMAGSAFGIAAHQLYPSLAVAAGACGLIGMGALLGGATGAPITAVVTLFELTGQYAIVLPLMTAVAMAAGTARLLGRHTIYTAKLWRRGIDLDPATAPNSHASAGNPRQRATVPQPDDSATVTFTDAPTTTPRDAVSDADVATEDQWVNPATKHGPTADCDAMSVYLGAGHRTNNPRRSAQTPDASPTRPTLRIVD